MEFGILEDYAIRMVLFLAKSPKNIFSRNEISEAMQIPLSVIAKIGQTLEVSGIVEIYKGKKGGYRLKKNPSETTLLEVLESFRGPIALNKCIDNPNFCSRESFCPVYFIWKEINKKFRDLLKIDFQSLIEKEKELKTEKS